MSVILPPVTCIRKAPGTFCKPKLIFQINILLWLTIIILFHCIKIDEQHSQDQGGQDDQPRFGAERATGPQNRTCYVDSRQLVNIQTGYREAENHAFEEVPADVKSNREPELP